MSMWTAIMILGVVAISAWARVQRARYNAQHGIVENRRGQIQSIARPADAELQREVEDLRERIKVLERITTDSRHTLAISDEIEKLRDR